MPSKMPRTTSKTKLKTVTVKQKKRQQALARTGVAAALIGLVAIGGWKLLMGRSGHLDTSNGMNLLPQDTFFSVSISTDPERWQKFTEFGVPLSRGVFQQQIAKFQTDFLTYYGYDYQRDIQPWIGKQILLGYLDNPGATAEKVASGKTANQQTIAILPINDRGAAQRAIEQHQTPIDANLIESNYNGVAIREFKRRTGTMAIAMIDNYVAITTDRSSLERVIDTHQGGKSLLTVPGYTKALTEIEIDRPFAQLYMNIPVAMAVGAASSPKTLDAAKLAQAQIQQGIAANATLEPEGIAWKGISWLKPDTKEKFLVENQGQNMAENFPADTLLMISGGNLQRLWQDYTRSAESNPIPSFTPNDLVKEIDKLTGLTLDSEILNWSKGPFSVAILPKTTKIDTDFGAGLVMLQQASDRSAAEKTFARLDATMQQKKAFKVEKVQIGGKEAISWSTPVGVAAANHGWLDRNLAFVSVGAPVADTFVPHPQSRLSDNKLFQQSTRSNLDHHNGQFFIDVDRTINAGNLPLPALSPEVRAGFQAVKSFGVTSAIFDESSNRFDMFVALKKVPGVASLPSPPPKVVKPAVAPVKAPVATPAPSP
jgi:Protein of unknown function (DUF3352)